MPRPPDSDDPDAARVDEPTGDEPTAAGPPPDDTAPPASPAADAADQPTTHPGVERPSAGPGHIGPFRVLRKLGEGGMGDVYVAHQETPCREVAVKVVKRGMDTRAVIARFESERQALGLMSHPNIARVFDAGETEEGRPYFVMEHVEGLPITQCCDRHRLTTRERLELFVGVCRGVQHAHQKGIIHRDLKPSNILVTEEDDRPVAKIIDFGIAKATAPHLARETAFTEIGMIVGTPEYMSPEQAEGGGADVDTRTDVYSLGVVLYELLTGALPFDARELREASYEEIRRRIREDEPPRPSTRVSRDDASDTVAARRRTEPGALVGRLRGDLDWITLRALDKDRARRYDSAAELAADVTRHLDDLPVLASPPSAVYRARKFVRRHRVGVAFAATVALAVVALAVSMTLQTARIARERDRAEVEAAKAAAVSQYLRDTLSKADPFSEAGKADLTVREALDQAAETIDVSFADQPAVGAAVRHAIGMAYVELDVFERGEELLEAAWEQRGRLYGDGPEAAHHDLAESLEGMATLRWQQYRDEEADDLAARAVAMREELHGRRHPAVAEALSLRGSIAVNLGHDRGVAYMREALAIFEELGIEDERTAETTQSLGFVLDREDPAASEALLRRTIDIYRRTHGPRHPITLYYGELVLAERIHVWGRPAEARRMMEPLVEPLRARLGEIFQLADLLRVLGKTYNETGDPGRAIPRLEEAAAIYTKVGAPDTFQAFDARSALAAAECLSGAVATGLARFAELAEQTATEDVPSASGAGGLVRLRYAECLVGADRSSEARAILEEITDPSYEEDKRAVIERLDEGK